MKTSLFHLLKNFSYDIKLKKQEKDQKISKEKRLLEELKRKIAEEKKKIKELNKQIE